MKYKTVRRNRKYCILEVDTDQILACFKTQDIANNNMNYLNYGGGFDGWTPEFLCIKELKYKYT
tara:strand:- start:2422 stop:2613 length:192 start_codon:yes stop_codon:yes gene_type:complete